MWRFPRSGPEDSNKSSKLDEFFASQNPTTSIVRESLQNSLDAKPDARGGPVRVRFTLSERNWADLEPWIGTNEDGLTLNTHTASEDLEQFKADYRGQTFRCLTIEDYNTDGLTGDTDKDAARSGSNFVGFWWNEGITGKKSGTSGSHGVGKTTLTKLSGMSSFLAVTKRRDDDRVFLLGFSNLPFHQLSGSSYLGYGRFGVMEGNGDTEHLMPIEDPPAIEQFNKAFDIERSDYGLSVLIPAVDDRVKSASVAAAVLEDYYWPILKGLLIVEVVDKEVGAVQVIDAASVDQRIRELGDPARRLQSLVEKARQVIAMQGKHPNFFQGIEPKTSNTPNGATRYSLTAECFAEENLEKMREEFEKGNMIGVSFPVPLEPNGGPNKRGLFEVFIEPDTGKGSDRIEQFIRKRIVISRQKTNIAGKYGACFVVVEDLDMSDYLMLAEEPAHTNWTFRLLNEKKKYKSDAALRFAMSAASELHRILIGDDEEQDTLENVAEDIFSINKPSDESGKQSRKPKHPERTKEKEVDPKPASVPLIRVERLDDGTGFEVLPVKQFSQIAADQKVSLPIRITVRSAYLSVRGNSRSWKDYSPIDFGFGDNIEMNIEPISAGDIISASENEFVVEVNDEDFVVKSSGFDPHRDLLIKTTIGV